jgi:hypothetical protein
VPSPFPKTGLEETVEIDAEVETVGSRPPLTIAAALAAALKPETFKGREAPTEG